MKTYLKPLFLFSGCALAAISTLNAGVATPVTTDPVGYVTADLVDGYTAVGITFTKAAIFTGALDAGSTTTTLTLVNTPTLGADQYYVEVLSSAANIVGERVDIASIAGNVITIAAASHNTIDDVSGFVAGSVVTIRPHFTIGDFDALIAASVNSDDSFDAAFSDQILLFDGGFKTHLNWQGDWYQNFGDFGLVTDQILPPGSGLFYHRNPAAGTPSTISAVFTGTVRMNNYVQKLLPGYQFVASGYPIDASPADFQYSDTLEASTSFDPAESDLILTWDGSFRTHLLYDDGAGLTELYKNFGDFAVVEDTDLFTPSSAYFVFIKTTGQVLEIARPF